MATKSFTDLGQSKRLAKFLPPESADMRYNEYTNHIDGTPKVGYKKGIADGIPCWSLAALMNIVPNGIVMNKDSQNGRYHFSSKYIGTYVTADNPVDACVEMIIKLNELKML